MRITVLGKSPAWQDAGGACSGYLIEEGDASVLLDCGSGVFAKLRARTRYEEVDAVVVSHLHADHIMDLVPYASALAYSPRRAAAAGRPGLFVPPGARDGLKALCTGGGMNPEHLERNFGVREYDPDGELSIGPLAFRFCRVEHFTLTYAVQVRSPAGARFTFSADTGPSPALASFAAGSDLFIIEATLLEPEPEGPRGHLTAPEAGDHGRRAGAGRLVLTHFSDELDEALALEEAARSFGGEVEMAREGAVYEL